jgi:hypothetical protein
MTTTMKPIHPGEVLMLDFLEPLGVTQHRLAVSIDVPRLSRVPWNFGDGPVMFMPLGAHLRAAL